MASTIKAQVAFDSDKDDMDGEERPMWQGQSGLWKGSVRRCEGNIRAGVISINQDRNMLHKIPNPSRLPYD
jgi:hypothetical protein